MKIKRIESCDNYVDLRITGITEVFLEQKMVDVPNEMELRVSLISPGLSDNMVMTFQNGITPIIIRAFEDHGECEAKKPIDERYEKAKRMFEETYAFFPDDVYLKTIALRDEDDLEWSSSNDEWSPSNEKSYFKKSDASVTKPENDQPVSDASVPDSLKAEDQLSDDNEEGIHPLDYRVISDSFNLGGIEYIYDYNAPENRFEVSKLLPLIQEMRAKYQEKAANTLRGQSKEMNDLAGAGDLENTAEIPLTMSMEQARYYRRGFRTGERKVMGEFEMHVRRVVCEEFKTMQHNSADH